MTATEASRSADAVPSARTLDVQDTEALSFALGAGGMATLALSWVLDSRVLRLLGFAATVAAGGLYARARFGERHERIEAAESHIRSELETLDPVARAQVLADIARHPKREPHKGS